jgi:transposase
MSLQPRESYPIPEETAQVARAIFPKGNLVMRLYDELGMLVQDQAFADLSPIQGQPAEAPTRLALVTLLQFMEGLTDRQAAEAVRTRIDWKYLLGLELTDLGFDHSVLSEFRRRLLTHQAEQRLFDAVLDLARARGLLKAGVGDDVVTATIHADLAEQDLLPAQHIADTGFVNSKLLVDSRKDYGIELIGPTRADNHWQAKTGTGLAASEFMIDWDAHQATCPTGKTSASWTPAIDKFKNHVVKIKFANVDCRVCPSSALCTRTQPPRRTITVGPQAQHEALLAGRQREQTEQFAKLYAIRAGVEGTIAQGVRSCGMRRSRYIGQARTHLQHLMTAAAMNVVRLLRWLAGETQATTPRSAFARLFPAAA